MIRVPLALRRPWLLLRDAKTDRERPDLAGLGAIEDPEEFVWAILPHAARTFSACIALLPAESARASAVAYLHCRMLDTYEDLVPDAARREEAVRAFAARFEDGARPGPAPAIETSSALDARDDAHLLLVRRCELVDRVRAALRPEVRSLVGDLVRDMAQGMLWSSRVFAEQGGALRDEEQLARYCRNVLGNPVRFVVRLLRLPRHGDAPLPDDVERDAMTVGEMVQLANVTRDVEKDLRRGIAYLPSLAADVGRDDLADPALVERVRAARERMLEMALVRAPAYRRMVDAMELPRLSLSRASAVLMMLFTERHFRGCAARVGRTPWRGADSAAGLILASLPAAVSRRAAQRRLLRIERDFLAAASAP